MVRVQVLGKLMMKAGGVSVAFPRGLVGELFRLLLVTPGEVLSNDALGQGLWPGTTSEVARRRLHVTVSRLRSFLSSHAADELRIVQEDEGYRLHATAESVDRIAFEELAMSALANGDSEAVEEALALWGGEP